MDDHPYFIPLITCAAPLLRASQCGAFDLMCRASTQGIPLSISTHRKLRLENNALQGGIRAQHIVGIRGEALLECPLRESGRSPLGEQEGKFGHPGRGERSAPQH
jgi:hypothetical protein